ncbi:hypothetical protein ACR42D_17895 [Desulfovibrio caledoniensis]
MKLFFVPLWLLILSIPTHAYVQFTSHVNPIVRDYSNFDGIENYSSTDYDGHRFQFTDFSIYSSYYDRLRLSRTANGYGNEGDYALTTSFHYNNEELEIYFNDSITDLLFFIGSSLTPRSKLYATVYDGSVSQYIGPVYYLGTSNEWRYLEFSSQHGKFDKIVFKFTGSYDYPKVSFDSVQYEFYIPLVTTPEPSTFILLCAGFLVLLSISREPKVKI